MSSTQLSPLSSFLVYCAANWIAPFVFPQHLSLTPCKLYYSFVPHISVSVIITSARLPKPESCHSRLFILQLETKSDVWAVLSLEYLHLSFAVLKFLSFAVLKFL